jgi:vancomycin resistance protein YoaR
MGKAKEEKSFDAKRLLLIFCGGFFTLYVLALIIQSFMFSNRFGPNVRIGGISLAGKDKSSAQKTLETAWSDYDKNEVEIGTDKIPVTDLVKGVNFQGTIDQAFDEQRKDYLSFGSYKKREFPIQVVLKDDKIYKILSADYKKETIPPVDAKIILTPSEKVLPGKTGKRLLLAESRENISSGLGYLQKKISLREEEVRPALNELEALGLLSQAKDVVSRDIVLTKGNYEYRINKATLSSWLKVAPGNIKSVVVKETFDPKKDEIQSYTFLDQQKVNDYVADLTTKINKTSTNAKLTVKDGKVAIAAPAVIGAKLDTIDTINKIQEASLDHRKKDLKVETSQPEVSEDNLPQLGITELISTGWTDAVGSPSNRIHNYTTGAAKFNGVLIKPGQNFSFNETLGPVDASTGYLPELVIKEDKTVPEYGGGMCQVSSTAFRAALNAGLPILERLYHAYPVQYYKPYGVDATVYLPKPDLVFKNDTDHYILIQTRIEKTKVYFDFYGTKVNRTIKFSGNENANGAVETVEKVNPGIYDQGSRGTGSFTAVVYRHIYDSNGKLTDNDKFTSKYDSPSKYPH